jgi:hypothetical protein
MANTLVLLDMGIGKTRIQISLHNAFLQALSYVSSHETVASESSSSASTIKYSLCNSRLSQAIMPRHGAMSKTGQIIEPVYRFRGSTALRVLFRESIVILPIQFSNESKGMTRYNKDVLEITLIIVILSVKKFLCIEAVTNVAVSELASSRSISALNVG